jgi:hypothetical protein
MRGVGKKDLRHKTADHRPKTNGGGKFGENFWFGGFTVTSCRTGGYKKTLKKHEKIYEFFHFYGCAWGGF